MDDATLSVAIRRLSPEALDQLRRLLGRDQANSDAVAQQALRRGADDLANIIDMLSLDEEVRRRVVRLLGELEVSSSSS